MVGTEPSDSRAEGSRAGEWWREPDGMIVAEVGHLRLVVHPPCAVGYVRFLVMRRPERPTSRYVLLSSGTEESVQAAMRAAERSAARIASYARAPTEPLPRSDWSPATSARPSVQLSGRRVLVVEDEWVIARDLEQVFRKCGAEVAGPVPSVDGAQELLAAEADLDGAVLDVNLNGQMVYPLADRLARRGVPFVFATGYDAERIPERYANVPRCYKPVDADTVARTLGRQLPQV